MRPLRPFFTVFALALLAPDLVGCIYRDGPTPDFPPPPPPVPGAPIVYYRFPIMGKWRVLRTHYGASQRDQPYALDLIPDARVREKRQNTGYPCYNVPVVADAPGIVVIAVDGIPENVPGQKNGYDQHGNYVVIDHQNGEFSLMAHFIPGSLKVRPGTQVQAGTELGRCGNSGLSTLPHIHWQVMDNANASIARGILPRYAPYLRNGTETSAPPERNDKIENK